MRNATLGSHGGTITVIIPTYNGAHRILNPLRSLTEQTVPPHEVIVVVDGSIDNTEAILEDLAFQVPNMRIIVQENMGRAGARNRGVEAATGELLLFLDDDSYAPQGWVEEHMKQQLRTPDSLVSGTLEISPQIPEGDFLRFKLWLDNKWSATTAHIEGVGVPDPPYLTAGNLSVSRRTFWELGGFDSRLTDAEDYDLAVRARNAGYSIFLSRSCFVYNNDQDLLTVTRYLRRLRQYTQAHDKLATLKPELHPPSNRAAAIASQNRFKRTAFGFFATRGWIESVDSGTWRWLPAKIRYKLYDIILTANAVVFPDKVPV
jgi:glycosyltransferase involved in cell wall biosynthesis